MLTDTPPRAELGDTWSKPWDRTSVSSPLYYSHDFVELLSIPAVRVPFQVKASSTIPAFEAKKKDTRDDGAATTLHASRSTTPRQEPNNHQFQTPGVPLPEAWLPRSRLPVAREFEQRYRNRQSSERNFGRITKCAQKGRATEPRKTIVWVTNIGTMDS